MIIQKYTLKTVYLCNHNIVNITHYQADRGFSTLTQQLPLLYFIIFGSKSYFFGYNFYAVLLFVY